MAELTGKAKPGEWKNVGGAIATDVAGRAVKYGEGALMKGLGIDGKLGTRANPMWVQMAQALNGATIGSSPFFQSALSKASGGESPLDTTAGLLTSLLPSVAIPGFASGVDNFGGGFALLGEEGPEVGYLPKGSSVIPNRKASQMFGGGDTHNHTWNIDARQANDPAATMMMVRRGIMEAAPHLASLTMRAQADANSRRPPSARR